jgi:hypothetical protein
VPEARPASLAERVYVPTALTEQPANVTTPLNWVAVQFARAAPLGPDAIDKETEANAVVTMLLLASSTATTGWNPKGLPTVEEGPVMGELKNAKWVAAPAAGMGRAKGSSTTKLRGGLTTPVEDVTVIVIKTGELTWGEMAVLTVHAPGVVHGTNEGGFVELDQ